MSLASPVFDNAVLLGTPMIQNRNTMFTNKVNDK